MAFRHSCLNAGRSGSLKCPGGDGKPGKGPKKCPGCGATLLIEEGRYGVFQWDPAGRAYREGDMATQAAFQIPGAAQRCADRMTDTVQTTKPEHRGYVVRWIRDRLLPIGARS